MPVITMVLSAFMDRRETAEQEKMKEKETRNEKMQQGSEGLGAGASGGTYQLTRLKQGGNRTAVTKGVHSAWILVS